MLLDGGLQIMRSSGRLLRRAGPAEAELMKLIKEIAAPRFCTATGGREFVAFARSPGVEPTFRFRGYDVVVSAL